MGDLLHKFDWYQATVPAHPELVIGQLLTGFPGAARTDKKGMFNYLHTAELASSDGEVHCRVFHGGPNGNPNVSATGDRAVPLASIIRDMFAQHRVTHCDVAVDLNTEGLFAEVVKLLESISKEYGMSFSWIGNSDPSKGWTYYLGAPSSNLRLRVYEKGKQLLGHTGDRSWTLFQHWVRLELIVRPQKDFKVVAATMEPEEFWGCSPWSRLVAKEVLAMNPTPLSMKPVRETDHERAIRFALKQYGGHFLKDMKNYASPEEWGRVVYERITETGEWGPSNTKGRNSDG